MGAPERKSERPSGEDSATVKSAAISSAVTNGTGGSSTASVPGSSISRSMLRIPSQFREEELTRPRCTENIASRRFIQKQREYEQEKHQPYFPNPRKPVTAEDCRDLASPKEARRPQKKDPHNLDAAGAGHLAQRNERLPVRGKVPGRGGTTTGSSGQQQAGINNTSGDTSNTVTAAGMRRRDMRDQPLSFLDSEAAAVYLAHADPRSLAVIRGDHSGDHSRAGKNRTEEFERMCERAQKAEWRRMKKGLTATQARQMVSGEHLDNGCNVVRRKKVQNGSGGGSNISARRNAVSHGSGGSHLNSVDLNSVDDVVPMSARNSHDERFGSKIISKSGTFSHFPGVPDNIECREAGDARSVFTQRERDSSGVASLLGAAKSAAKKECGILTAAKHPGGSLGKHLHSDVAQACGTWNSSSSKGMSVEARRGHCLLADLIGGVKDSCAHEMALHRAETKADEERGLINKSGEKIFRKGEEEETQLNSRGFPQRRDRGGKKPAGCASGSTKGFTPTHMLEGALRAQSRSRSLDATVKDAKFGTQAYLAGEGMVNI